MRYVNYLLWLLLQYNWKGRQQTAQDCCGHACSAAGNAKLYCRSLITLERRRGKKIILGSTFLSGGFSPFMVLLWDFLPRLLILIWSVLFPDGECVTHRLKVLTAEHERSAPNVQLQTFSSKRAAPNLQLQAFIILLGTHRSSPEPLFL